MAKTEVGTRHYATLYNPAATTTAGSNKIGVEVDTGGAANGTLILSVVLAASSDLANLEVWTSSRSDFAASGTALTTLASDGRRIITIASDGAKGMCYAASTTAGSISDLTIASGVVANITQTGMYVFALKDLSRYVNFQFDNDGTGSVLSAVFIGHDLPEAPWAGARTAY